MLEYLYNFYNDIDKNSFKNSLIACSGLVIVSLIYLNIKKTEQIDKLSLVNDNLRSSYTMEEFRNINSNNWDYLFKNDMYEIYKSSEHFGNYVVFSHELFLSALNLKLQKFDFIEHNLKETLNNVIFKNNGVNKFNYHIINYEILNCFKKISILAADATMNELLYRKYNINYPFYNQGSTGLNEILIEKHRSPLSYEVDYLKKNNFKKLYRNKSFLKKQIKKF